jgi:hypothetical protein
LGSVDKKEGHARHECVDGNENRSIIGSKSTRLDNVKKNI